MLPHLHTCRSTALAADAIPPIPRVLPPEGLEIPAEVRTRLETRLASHEEDPLDGIRARAMTCKPDIEVFTKAVECALLHREFYVEKDFAKADWALDEANKRLDSLASGQSPWTKATGLVVEGYRSSIDDSAAALWPGHSAKTTTLTSRARFTSGCTAGATRTPTCTSSHERATRPGQIAPPGAIVVHPFGRHCVGWKHAGEIDVLEAVNAVKAALQDRSESSRADRLLDGRCRCLAHRRALHRAAGSPFRPAPASSRRPATKSSRPTAIRRLVRAKALGPVRRARLRPQPVQYRTSSPTAANWTNRFKPLASWRKPIKAEGRTLTHLIGPGVEHKYEPNTLAELMKRLEARSSRRGDEQTSEGGSPANAHTALWPAAWVAAEGLEEHWEDSRIDAERGQ